MLIYTLGGVLRKSHLHFIQSCGKNNGMTGLYPEIEPYDRGILDVRGGNLIYWEASGNPKGLPAQGPDENDEYIERTGAQVVNMQPIGRGQAA